MQRPMHVTVTYDVRMVHGTADMAAILDGLAAYGALVSVGAGAVVDIRACGSSPAVPLDGPAPAGRQRPARRRPADPKGKGG